MGVRQMVHVLGKCTEEIGVRIVAVRIGMFPVYVRVPSVVISFMDVIDRMLMDKKIYLE